MTVHITYSATAVSGTIHEIKGVFATQAEADAAATADADLTAYTGSVANAVEPQWFFDTATNTAAPTRPQPVAEARRELVKEWLLTDFDRQNLTGWSASDDDTALTGGRWAGLRPRAANTIAWAVMIDRASRPDGNLTDEAKWGLIKAEMDLGTQLWYVAHNVTGWTAIRHNLESAWYATGAGGIAVLKTSLDMTLPAGDTNHKFTDYLK